MSTNSLTYQVRNKHLFSLKARKLPRLRLQEAKKTSVEKEVIHLKCATVAHQLSNYQPHFPKHHPLLQIIPDSLAFVRGFRFVDHRHTKTAVKNLDTILHMVLVVVAPVKHISKQQMSTRVFPMIWTLKWLLQECSVPIIAHLLNPYQAPSMEQTTRI